MTITITNEIQRILPPRVRRQVGFKRGDQLEVKDAGGVVTLIPKLPAADDEYTPAQRRIIDAGIAAGQEDFRRGRAHGPFATAKQATAYIERMAREKAAAAKPSKHPRR